jgi:Gpi18-like mannosyltransferase
MKRIFILLVFLSILVIFVNKISNFWVFDRTSYELPPGLQLIARPIFLPFLNFDGRHYLEIAQNGYEAKNKLLAFFPLYPLLIKFLSINSLINPIIVGLTVSFSCSLLALFFLYKLVKLEYKESVAKKTIYLIIFFPSSFYLISYYPEGLFLLLTVLTFYFLKQKKYLSAALTTALATATRLVGIALLPVLLFEGYQYFKKNGKIPWFLLISPLGLLSFVSFITFKFGDPFYILGAQTDPSFGRNFEILNPIKAFISSFTMVLQGPQDRFDSIFVYPVIIGELFWGLFGLVIIILSFRKIYFGYWLFLVAGFLIPLMSGVLSANIRHLLVLFPIAIFLATKLNERIYPIWIIISFILLIFASTIFLNGYWIA